VRKKYRQHLLQTFLYCNQVESKQTDGKILVKGPSKSENLYFLGVFTKKITFFSHFRASATKAKTDFELLLIGYIR